MEQLLGTDRTANNKLQSQSGTDSGIDVASSSSQSPGSTSISSPEVLQHTDHGGLPCEAGSHTAGLYPSLVDVSPPETLPELRAEQVKEMPTGPAENSSGASCAFASPLARDKAVLPKEHEGANVEAEHSNSVQGLEQSSLSVVNAIKERNTVKKESCSSSLAGEAKTGELPAELKGPFQLPSSPDSDSTSSARTSSGATEDVKSLGAVGGSKLKKTGSSPSPDDEVSSTYYVKWITFNKRRVPVITQNENGPCPLIAIVNVLLLKEKIQLPSLVEMVTSKQLMDQIGEYVLTNTPKNLDTTHLANYEQNVQDAISMMHKLQTGLDVNVRFTGVSDFEYTSECIIFDLLEIALYHGWLVDPQDSQTVEAVGKYSYNQLVERIIQHNHSNQDELVREALLAEQFLDRTASQLTYHGLCELCATVKDQELCVFFRNNHFGTLYKHNNELFLLVTDQGFLTESSVVWETLSNVDGDCHFVDGNFCTYTKPQPSTAPVAASPYTTGDEQINSDFQVALSLQHQDQQMIAEQEAAWGPFPTDFDASHASDHELALRLQEEEDRQAAASLNQQRQGQGQGQGQAAAPRAPEERRDKKDGKDVLACKRKCCIL